MLDKQISTPYPRIDADPHFARVVSYFRPSDYAAWATGTAAFPTLLWLWEKADKTGTKMRTPMRLGGFLGFFGGFLFAYQRSSLRFWGWTENKREEELDIAEMRQRIKDGQPLGTSNQPEWVQQAAHRNSLFSQLKFSAVPMFNFVDHRYHGVDPAKYSEKQDKDQ